MGSSYIYSNFIPLFMICGAIALLYCLLHKGARRWVAGGLALVCAVVVVWYFLPFRIPVVESDRASVSLYGKTGLVELSREQQREISRLCNALTYSRQVGETSLHTAVGASVKEYIELTVATEKSMVRLWLATDEDGFSQYDGVYGVNSRLDRVRNPQALIAYLKSIMTEEAFQGVEPVETVLDFDLALAQSMISDWERNMAWLSTQESLSLDEAKAFQAVMNDTLPGYGTQALHSLFSGEAGGPFFTKWERLPNLFCPTIFHQGVEVVSAQEVQVEEYVLFSSELSLTGSTLTIRVAYLGEDERLTDWYREFLFIRYHDQDEWHFERFGGSMNLSGDEFSPNYLPLRDETIESPIDGT